MLPGVKKLPLDPEGNPAIPEKRAVVLFWAEWCPHCRKYKPTYQKLAKLSRAVYQLHCPDNEAVCNKFGVRSFPTLMYWKNGQLEPCSIGRNDIAELKRWIENGQGGGARSRRRRSPRRRSRGRSRGRSRARCTGKTMTGARCGHAAGQGMRRCWQHA